MRTKLSSLKWIMIGGVYRDPVFPHYVILTDIFGRRIMQFTPEQGNVYDGKGNVFRDDVTEFAPKWS